MNLSIKPHHKNIYPLSGVLIKGPEPTYWLRCLQALQVDLNITYVFAIPGPTPKSIWGCFVQVTLPVSTEVNDYHIQSCQSIQNKLYIPAYSELYPKINAIEIAKLFASNPHVFHPEFGLFELEQPIDWHTLLTLPNSDNTSITKPKETPFYPKTIHRIQIKALPVEDAIKKMEQDLFPKQEPFKDKPLSLPEKIKYLVLKPLYHPTKQDSNETPIKKKWLSQIESQLAKFLPKSRLFLDNLTNDFENLERRNRSELDKLMKLLKDNPEEALKYALPIDSEGITRGGNQGYFSMTQRWRFLSLFSDDQSGGTGTIIFPDESLSKLKKQYEKVAHDFIKQQEYEKAAFVYIKLLKDYTLAAKTLEDGELYSEAASVYLKYLKHKENAARCYEKGRMTTEAIELYKELKMNEKVGDLYITLNNQHEAFKYYNMVVEEHKTTGQYVKASLILRQKMDDRHTAQELLMSGWREQKDAFNCLNNYFENINDVHLLSKAINHVYQNETNKQNKPTFLKVLKYEFKKDKILAQQTKDMAYEIVADLAKSNPQILNELNAFNNDSKLQTDITRYMIK